MRGQVSETIKKLWRLGVGDVVIVNGQKHYITERVKYKEDGDGWLNLVWHDDDGREVALEVEGNKLSLWKEIEAILVSILPDGDAVIGVGGEKFSPSEEGLAKTISRTEKGVKKADTPYQVFEASSGKQLALEEWDGKKFAYILEGRLSAKAVQIP